mmetsp:Transcript_17767/g.26852  ORF Transcript_17767/g.26852 Transcript_17767/m.26852 type:complete len:255 (-) Transcript_17767:284-1048(-)
MSMSSGQFSQVDHQPSGAIMTFGLESSMSMKPFFLFFLPPPPAAEALGGGGLFSFSSLSSEAGSCFFGSFSRSWYLALAASWSGSILQSSSGLEGALMTFLGTSFFLVASSTSSSELSSSLEASFSFFFFLVGAGAFLISWPYLSASLWMTLESISPFCFCAKKGLISFGLLVFPSSSSSSLSSASNIFREVLMLTWPSVPSSMLMLEDWPMAFLRVGKDRASLSVVAVCFLTFQAGATCSSFLSSSFTSLPAS